MIQKNVDFERLSALHRNHIPSLARQAARLAGFTVLFSSFSACFWEGNTKVKLDHPLGSVELKAEAIQRQPSCISIPTRQQKQFLLCEGS